MRKLIQGGTVVTAADKAQADVLIDGEEIVAVGALGDVDAKVIEADGCYVLPGLIDNHTHMAMPFGGTHSIDDYDTGTRAAAAGGTTCIVDFVIQQHPDGLRSSLEEWQERAAKPAEGNARVVLSLAAAFAAPLLGPLQLEGAGIHFRGPSSIGKTTALTAAGSVWGGPRDHGGLNGYKQSWQATANAIEGLAQAHCDLPLCLDELSLVKGEDAARVGYQLASGIGRGRASTSGLTAARLEWRVFLISTGEISLADKIADARIPQRHMPGQAVRFIDLAADAGTGFGLFDHAPALAGKPNGGTDKDRGDALARNLSDAAQSCFGTAGPAFVEALIADREASLVEARRLINVFAEQHAGGADGQVQRVARTFGLLSAAGELAVAYGVLPWPAGEAVRAASRCFADWLADRGGTGAAEIEAAISHLRATIERDGASRFQRRDSREPVHQRLGFIRESDGDIEYLIQPETWKALMAGRDARQRPGDGVHQAGDGDEADDRDEEEERREEREKKVVGELRREIQAVVCRHLAAGALEDLGPADGDFQESEHQRSVRGDVRWRRPVPTVGVHDGGSLAGKDSADVS
jgi:hypothetical protein